MQAARIRYHQFKIRISLVRAAWIGFALLFTILFAAAPAIAYDPPTVESAPQLRAPIFPGTPVGGAQSSTVMSSSYSTPSSPTYPAPNYPPMAAAPESRESLEARYPAQPVAPPVFPPPGAPSLPSASPSAIPPVTAQIALDPAPPKPVVNQDAAQVSFDPAPPKPVVTQDAAQVSFDPVPPKPVVTQDAAQVSFDPVPPKPVVNEDAAAHTHYVDPSITANDADIPLPKETKLTDTELPSPGTTGWFSGPQHTVSVPASNPKTVPSLDMMAADGGSIRPEMARAWAEDLQALELENQTLRKKLQITETDPLRDIRVDAVSTIREDVLRTRVLELERELDKLQMKENSADLPQKSSSPSQPNAAPLPKLP